MNKSDLEDLLLKGNLNLLPATFLDDRDSQIISRVASIMRYWPDEELNPSLLLSLLRLPREFKKIRSIPHLRRVICAEFFYKKKVINALDQQPHKRHLFVKLLKTRLEFPFGSKSVLGMVATFNLMRQREAFEEGHILEAVRRIVANVTVVKGSFIDNQDKTNQVHIVYLEIERDDPAEFTLQEIKELQEQLPKEFKGCIEQLVPITFMRRNEEEVYRNILALRDQLRSVKDIPQTTITFEEQTQFDLFFTVVLLRLVKGKAPSIQELLTKEFPEVIIIPDRVDSIGVLRKFYRKEATVFRLQLPKSPFFRKDRSVNLYKARQKVFSMLVQALGPVRDYNGGLILKQNERLEDFLALMPVIYDEFFLENFFYSITPIAIQSILPAMLVKEWFLAFSELLEKELGRKEPYLLLSRHIDEAHMVIVRSEDSSFKEALLKEINQLAIPSLELAFSEVNMHGAFCFGFLYRPSLVGKERNFCKVVKETMEKWKEGVKEQQVLRMAVHGGDPSLDPRISRGDQSYIMVKMLFDGLTRIGPDGTPELAIAESYTVSSDYKTYTFHLRDSKWSNGMPITAYDFEYSWKNALKPQAKLVFSQSFSLIKNARQVQAGIVSIDEIGIHAIDDKTLVVELEYPAPYFLHVTAHCNYLLINSVIDQKYPGWAYQAGEKYVCNGPFKLAEWKHSRAIVVEKNPHYWDADSVRLKKVSIAMIERAQSEISMLKKGEIDIAGRPMTTFAPEWLTETMDDVEKVSFPSNGTYMLYFNTAQFPFNHKKIRQAFAYAIDREKVGKLVPHEFEKESYSPLPGNLSFHTEPLYPTEDLQKARMLFREGLGEIGFVKSDFPQLSLHFYNGHQRFPLFRALAKQWKEAFGIDVHLKHIEWGTYLDELMSGKFQMGAVEFNACWHDPLHLLEFFEEKNAPWNFCRWESPQYQKLLKQAKQAPSIEERDRYLKQAEALLAQHMPVVPLYQICSSFLKKKVLKNVFVSDTFEVDFKWTYKDVT